MTKEDIIKVIRQLPDGATVEDSMEKLYLIQKVERGIIQGDAGQKIPQEEARRQMERWLK